MMTLVTATRAHYFFVFIQQTAFKSSVMLRASIDQTAAASPSSQ